MPRAGWVVVALLLRSSTSRADSPAPEPEPEPAPAPAPPAAPSMPTPLDGFGVDVLDAFTGTNLLWYGGAIAQTGVLGDRHWVSDVVAGGLLGQAIGHSVGSAFRRRVRGESARETGSLRIAPIVSPTGFGVAASGAW